MKSSSAMPISDRVVTVSSAPTSPSPPGPAMTPVAMRLTMAGARRRPPMISRTSASAYSRTRSWTMEPPCTRDLL